MRWGRRSRVKLYVADPAARRRRGRLGRMRAAGWLPWRTASRSTTVRRYERSRHGEASASGHRAPDGAMLKQDPTAFVEALQLPVNVERERKSARDAARARLELVRLMPEVDALAVELEDAKRARDLRDYSRLPVMRRLRSGRRPAALEQEVEAARRRLERKQEELEATRLRTEALERNAREPSGPGNKTTFYRFHSADHYLGCSRRKYEHLESVQRATPVSLTTRNGLRWWWFRDRFWWAGRGLTPAEIESLVLDADLSGQYQREAVERARADLAGEDLTAADVVPEHVRRQVWIRDRGRCVDCGVESGLEFDFVLPPAAGGSSTVPNLELRCRPCQERRRDNEAKAAIGKARVRAHASKEWGVELKDGGWTRAS